MPRPLRDQVVVITGASSGIGRQTAIELAKHRASVVLAARREAALQETAKAVEWVGGKAQVVATDVTAWDQVERLAHAAVDRFGGIDTWVNGALVALYARLEHTTAEEFRRVVEVALLGTVHGTMAAVPAMQARGGGVIVNVSTVAGKRAVPFQSAYCASKFGIVGFSEAVRVELRRARISVCTVLPYSTNTPLFDHARSKEGYRPKPIPPVYDPSAVARAIVRCTQRPRREVVVGAAVGKPFLGLNAVAPWLVDWMLERLAWPLQFTREPDHGVDNFFKPLPERASSLGRWRMWGTRRPA